MTAAENRPAPSNPAPRSVPLLDLARQHAPLRAEVAEALMRVYDSGAVRARPAGDASWNEHRRTIAGRSTPSAARRGAMPCCWP